MRAYILTVVVVDHDDVEASGPGSIGEVIENARYPNRCISPDVVGCEAFDLGEWEDEHPLNYRATDKAAWLKENGQPCPPDAAQHEEEASQQARDVVLAEEKRQREAVIAGLTDEQRAALGLGGL